MNSLKKLLFIVGCLILFQADLDAQKFGYINSTQLLIEMPEITEADKQLEVYQKQLIARGEKMVQDWEKKYAEANTAMNNGELSQLQIQQTEAELNTERQKIAEYEVEVSQLLSNKREELYSPILNKVKGIIQEIGKENEYTMIFDTSTGSLLHAKESDNLIAMVKTRLGI